MKIDGNQQTFSYESVLWSNNETFQSNFLSLDDKEAKLASYWTLSFTELRLGMKVGGTTRWITFGYRASSLYSLIADGKYRETSIGKTKWRSLLPTSSMQSNCNKVSMQHLQCLEYACQNHKTKQWRCLSCKRNNITHACCTFFDNFRCLHVGITL